MRDEAKKNFLKNRMSVGLEDRPSSEHDDDKVSTLDPVVGATAHVQHLRPLLRSFYSQQGEEKGKLWREGDQGRIKITDFGMIDHPPDQSDKEVKADAYSSLNCFSMSSGCTVLEVNNVNTNDILINYSLS